jgi:alkanesulfonate monooxygenase SsuD/methylene tetrahydromethanopterin reductase-like flavin-dependent oxidoreductase (luciferase family)
MVRFIVVAETDDAALQIARRAYVRWLRSFKYLHDMHGLKPQLGERPPDYDGVIAKGIGIAGSPATVRAFLASQIEDSGANYLVGQFAFGDLTLDEMQRSVALFATDVMPGLRVGAADA